MLIMFKEKKDKVENLERQLENIEKQLEKK